MDELTLLRAMRTDLGTPTPAALNRGRQQLLRHIDPVARQAPKPSQRRRRLGLKIGLTAAAGATLAAALVAGDVIGPVGWRGAATAEAAEVLQEAALDTLRSSDPVVPSGQYLKVERTVESATFTTPPDGSELAWLEKSHDTLYIPSDRAGDWVWVRSGSTPTTFFDEASKAYAQANPTDYTGEVLRGAGGVFSSGAPGTSPLSPLQSLSELPRDPQQLLEEIYKRTAGQGQSVDGAALVYIADLLRTSSVPADLRAALYLAAAKIPGVTITDRQAALDGQVGVAIGRTEEVSHTRQDIIIDPETGLMIGERQVLTQAQGPLPAGTSISWTKATTSVAPEAP